MKKAVAKRGAAEAKEQPQAGSQKVNNAFSMVKKFEEEFHKVMQETKSTDPKRVPDKAHSIIEQALETLSSALAGM